ncbi:unnamed protein product [Cuscuta epithymum]|uniref:Tf2-1-like SH3-like domain-containing protein n=1 Tax=Cuscuta epithymum TaxID=186058 RepID=A0AAV0DLN5_9ASTE|nr:unnamed protein product [Cuscuta epithymum]
MDQNRMKQQANKHRKDVWLEVGERGFLKIQPYKLENLAKRINQELSPRLYGPFEIDKINPVAYKLKLQEDCIVHTVFHVSFIIIIIITPVPQRLPPTVG